MLDRNNLKLLVYGQGQVGDDTVVGLKKHQRADVRDLMMEKQQKQVKKGRENRGLYMRPGIIQSARRKG